MKRKEGKGGRGIVAGACLGKGLKGYIHKLKEWEGGRSVTD